MKKGRGEMRSFLVRNGILSYNLRLNSILRTQIIKYIFFKQFSETEAKNNW